MIWSVAIVCTFITALFVVDKLLAAPKYKEDTSNHFDGSKFVNPDGVGNHHYGDVLKWWLSGNDKGVWQKRGQDDVSQYPAPDNSVAPDECRITFVNHATFLIQIDGMNILTDPVWSYRASPYQWIGPKRMRPPGIEFNDLPDIDAVLISHNHYDHLDIRTVTQLKEQYKPQFVVPLGVEKYLQKNGITQTAHLDWWDEVSISDELKLTAVPARHFSGRGLFDRDKTLWCGYVLHTSLGNIYFAGDTGYGSFLKKVGAQFGPMRASLLPIGAYKPRWFMEHIHMSPEEAVQAHRDVQSRHSIAMHFGTFPMADDGMKEPAADLEKALQKNQIPGDDFVVLDEGDHQKVCKNETSRRNVANL